MVGRGWFVIVTTTGLALPIACGGKSESADGDAGAGQGGTGLVGTGGAGATGGTQTTTGGTSSQGSGAAQSSGGSSTTGGSNGKGGSNSTGGRPATAGSSSTSGSAGRSGGRGNSAGLGGTGTAGELSGAAGDEGLAGEAGAGGVTCLGSGENVVPDANGRVQSACNDVGIDGYWYAFADGVADRKNFASCLDPGLHSLGECSLFLTPDVGPNFPNVNGVMHTVGSVAKILPCASGVTTTGCPANDYLNMWGAGIGLTFTDGTSDEPAAWNPFERSVVGVRFTIDGVPSPGLRVEFPMLLTEDEAARADPPLPAGSTTEDMRDTGSPYWGAQANGDGKYPNSPVVAGVNTVLWTDVFTPKLGAYTWDPPRIIGIRFHIQTTTASAYPYNFSISNLAVVRAP